MPAEYVKMRDDIYRRCLAGTRAGKSPKGKKKDETCMQYAKRVASATFTKKHGKTPQQAESVVRLIEDVERLFGLVEDEAS